MRSTHQYQYFDVNFVWDYTPKIISKLTKNKSALNGHTAYIFRQQGTLLQYTVRKYTMFSL